MFRDKDLTDSNNNSGNYLVENSVTRPDLGQNMSNPDGKIGYSRNGLDFLGDSEMGCDGFRSNPSRPGNSGSCDLNRHSDLGQSLDKSSEKVGFLQKGMDILRESGMGCGGFQSKAGNSGCQELTLSYLCDNSKPGLLGLKGKGVVLESSGQEEKWVERDFLQLSDSKNGGLSKRDPEEGTRGEGDCSKKPKLETLKLSLAPPDVSLSLTAANFEAVAQHKPTRSDQAPVFSNTNNTQTTCSNDFTAASLSCSYSHPFSHNPSCSLTRNSTEYYEHSVGSRRRETDQIWNCGEGTNGSVHSRFKPIGEGTGLSNHGGGGGGGYALLNRGRPYNRDYSSNSLYKPAGSDSSSFFPSELPARPKIEAVHSIDSTGRSSRGERIVRDVISEPIPTVSQLFQELPIETIESAKEYLKSLVAAASERKDELVDLQTLLERRPDLTKETVSKAHNTQLEVLVAVKFGLDEFVSGKVRLQTSELVDIFLGMKCRNMNCKALLPVDDCECKICSTKKGFCSQCMCPVCYKYDCASNTCSWVGCDTCSHWCHAACAIDKNFIRPGSSLKGSSGTSTTQMQFYCLGCGHASEMFGFVKDVFVYCAKDWGLQALIKELDCVRRIFKASEDLKEKELYLKAAELITRLERRAMSPLDACNFIVQFFTNKDNTAELPPSGITTKEPRSSEGRGFINESATLSYLNVPPKSSMFNMTSPATLLENSLRHSLSRPHIDFLAKSSDNNKDDGVFDSLEGIARIKEAESRMFQNRADDARKEVEAYRELVRARTEKLEEEYAQKLAKLCLQETEERRRKKLEELKIVETSHSDYFNMKIRMQAEISGLLERMEATRRQWV